MLAYGVSMDIFLKQFFAMIQTVVVKREKKANECETVESRRLADSYIAMIETGDNWYAFSKFNTDVLEEAGLSQSIIESVLRGDKDAIPYEMRSLVCRLQREYIINNYIEYNDYYRMLNGEPPIDTDPKDFVYLPSNNGVLPPNIPVHLLPVADQEYIMTSSLKDTLLEQYPDKEYLKFLGSHKIPYYNARVAKNYELLYINRTENDSITSDFIKNYAACRNYTMIGLYSQNDSKLYENYDAFMGFSCMTMSIQKTFTSIFKQGITRNFYDDNLIRSLFDTYNLPYIESIGLSYQKDIAKKLNVLLQKKSTNEVLFDISSLFNFSGINIYRYYLMKDYKKNANGEPFVFYKEVVDEEGNSHSELDYEKTFDIFFQKVNIKSTDPSVEMNDYSNRVPYEALVADDPYWIEDADLINKLYTSKFNHTLTKYMSIDVAYQLAKLIYETSHSIRMIIDDQEEFKLFKVSIPYVSDPVSFFDLVLFLCALISKKFGLAGNVPTDNYKVAQVYGFNFKTDINLIKDEIVRDMSECTGLYKNISPDVFDYLVNFKAGSPAGAKTLYENIEKLRIWLDDVMYHTNDMTVYNACRKLYKSLLYTQDTADLYTKLDGTTANTFIELLEDRRPDLADVVNNTEAIDYTNVDYDSNKDEDPLSINSKINKSLEKISDISEGLKDVRYVNDKSEVVTNIEKLINQMKSYTVDQTTSGISYLLDDKHLTVLKFIDYMGSIIADKDLKSTLHMIYDDVFNLILVRMITKNRVDFNEKYFIKIHEVLGHIIYIRDDLIKALVKSTYNDSTKLYDAINTLHSLMAFDTTLSVMNDKIVNEKATSMVYDNIHLRCIINLIDVYKYLSDNEYIYDYISENEKLVAFDTVLNVYDKVYFYMKEFFTENIKFNSSISLYKLNSFNKLVSLYDTVNYIEVHNKLVGSMTIKDIFFTHRFAEFNEILSIRDDVAKYISQNLKTVYTFYDIICDDKNMNIDGSVDLSEDIACRLKTGIDEWIKIVSSLYTCKGETIDGKCTFYDIICDDKNMNIDGSVDLSEDIACRLKTGIDEWIKLMAKFDTCKEIISNGNTNLYDNIIGLSDLIYKATFAIHGIANGDAILTPEDKVRFNSLLSLTEINQLENKLVMMGDEYIINSKLNCISSVKMTDKLIKIEEIKEEI